MENLELDIIHSLGEAEGVAKYMILHGDIDGLYGLRDVILAGTAKGSADEFHNFCVNYASRGDYESACNLLKVGLQQHPFSTDLLADYLQYGIKCGKTEECNEYYTRLKDIPKERWTWRSFDFSIDYLKELTSAFSNPEIIEEKKEEMLSLADEFQRQMPYDEQPFLAKAEIFEFFGLHADATTTLKIAVDSIKVSPKCCLKYSDLMLERGEYNEVISSTKRGIIASAQDQATVNIGYLFFLSALAKDALIHESEAYNDSSIIFDAYTDYRIAETLLDAGRIAYLKTIKTRTLILEIKSGIAYKKEENIECDPEK